MSWFDRLLGKEKQNDSIRSKSDNIRDSLAAQQGSSPRPEKAQLTGASAEAIRLATDRPPMWEHRLFLQVLINEVDGYKRLRQARDSGSGDIAPEEVSIEQTFIWMRERNAEAMELANKIETLTNQDLIQALGPPGQNGNASLVIMVARQLGDVYKRFLEQSIRCTNARRTARGDGVFREMARINDDAIRVFEEFPSKALKSIIEAVEAPPRSSSQVFDLVMRFSMNPAALIAEIDNAEEAMSRGN